MYEEALALLSQPAEVKRQLPIAYVLEQSGVQVISGEGRLHARCPFHDDHDPSFDVFPWGDAERWGCWVCGISGDVFDLLQRFTPGLGFRPSVDAAVALITKMREEGWVAPDLGHKYEWDAPAALSMLSRCVEDSAIYTFCRAKGLQAPPNWLAGMWGVRSNGVQILAPYYDPQGHLVAVKHRPVDGSRAWLSLPGSKLRGHLYVKPYAPDTDRPVLVTEGETDTWEADWQLGDRWDVWGISAGAGAPPYALERFRDRDVLVAFDGDEAGRQGALRWFHALHDVAARVRTLDTPDGADLTSLGDLSFLLDLID